MRASHADPIHSIASHRINPSIPSARQELEEDCHSEEERGVALALRAYFSDAALFPPAAVCRFQVRRRAAAPPRRLPSTIPTPTTLSPSLPVFLSSCLPRPFPFPFPFPFPLPLRLRQGRESLSLAALARAREERLSAALYELQLSREDAAESLARAEAAESLAESMAEEGGAAGGGVIGGVTGGAAVAAAAAREAAAKERADRLAAANAALAGRVSDLEARLGEAGDRAKVAEKVSGEKGE